MNLLIITGNPYPCEIGGNLSFLRDFEKGLNYHKVDYEIISPKFHKGKIFKKTQNTKNLGIHLKTYGSFTLRTLFKIPYYLIWYFSTIIYLIKNKKYQEFDCIHAQDLVFSAPIALLLGKITKKKVFFTTHNGVYPRELEKMLPNVFYKKFIIKIAEFLDRVYMPKFNGIFCISRELKKHCLNLNKNCVFIPNFIDISKFKHKIRSKVKTIGYVGRLSKEKNIDIIIKTAKFFPEKKFLIIGTGNEDTALKKLTKDLNVKNIEFLGLRKDIPELHKKIDLFVYIRENEPFGISALEAISSGIPVIANDTNELHYFVGIEKTGIVIKKPGVNELRNAINEISKPGVLEKCSKNTLSIAKRYELKTVTKDYLENYKK